MRGGLCLKYSPMEIGAVCFELACREMGVKLNTYVENRVKFTKTENRSKFLRDLFGTLLWEVGFVQDFYE